MSKRMRYLTLQSTAEGQAAHTHVHEIIRGLEKRGWRIDLSKPDYAQVAPGLLQRLATFASVHRRFLRRTPKPDVVYVRWHVASLPGVLGWRARRIPVVLEVNGPYEDLFIAWPQLRLLRAPLRWAMRLQLRKADAVITVTEGLAAWIRQQAPGQDVQVIENGANTDLFHPGVNAEEFPIQSPYVCFVGALASWQGVDTLLDAVGSSEWPEGVLAVIAGDGPMRKEIEARKEPGVCYLGRVPYRSVPGLLVKSLAGISVQTNPRGRSSTGLSPLKVYEYMACGIPSIVSDLPGQAETVRDHACGIVVPSGDPRMLARAVARLLNDPARRAEMGVRARQAAETMHSWDQRAAATALVLERLAVSDATAERR